MTTMGFSKEFFNQRSFEVAWAVFRVAQKVGRERVRQGLEERAVDYLLYKDEESLQGIEEVIRFAFQIGEVSRVNAGVILREIATLRQSLKVLREEQVHLLPESGNEEDFNIEEIFSSKPPLPDFKKSGNIESGNVESQESDNTESGNIKDALNIDSNRVWQSEQKSGNVESQESGNTESGNQKSGNVKKSGNIARNNDQREAKKRAILGVLGRRNLCHISDVLAELQDTSPRTVRYHIQNLVDSGIVERLGKGGPNSFFRLKK